MYLKGKLYRDKNFLSFVRSRPCLITGRTDDTVAHHVRLGQGGGMGIKPSDYRTLPLHPLQHSRLHNIGEKTFWGQHGIDPWKEIITQSLVYLSTVIPFSDLGVGIGALEEAICCLKDDRSKKN